MIPVLVVLVVSVFLVSVPPGFSGQSGHLFGSVLGLLLDCRHLHRHRLRVVVEGLHVLQGAAWWLVVVHPLDPPLHDGRLERIRGRG